MIAPTPARFPVLVLVALLLAAPAHAVTIGFDPSTTIASVGESFTVDVVISDLGGEIVAAYDLDILFDDAVLTADFVSFHAALGAPPGALYDAILAPGLLDVAGVSFLSDAALLALQGGDSVTIASLGFTKTGGGATSLGFVLDAVNDIKGADNQILDVAASPGSVRPPGEIIPEPSAALTFGAGMLVTSWALRRGASRGPARAGGWRR